MKITIKTTEDVVKNLVKDGIVATFKMTKTQNYKCFLWIQIKPNLSRKGLFFDDEICATKCKHTNTLCLYLKHKVFLDTQSYNDYYLNLLNSFNLMTARYENKIIY